MTYLLRARPRPRRIGMSGLVDDMVDEYSTAYPYGAAVDPTVMMQAQCAAKAVDHGRGFQAKIADIDATWTPTGFFPPDDVRGVISSTMQLEAMGRSALDTVQSDAHVRTDLLNKARNALDRAGARAVDFLDAARQADAASVRLVNAPGLKQWVVDTMNAASSAMIVADAVGCMKPTWLSAIQAYDDAFDVAKTHVVAIAGEVLQAGETAVKVATNILENLNLLLIAGIGIGGYLLWKKHLR